MYLTIVAIAIAAVLFFIGFRINSAVKQKFNYSVYSPMSTLIAVFVIALIAFAYWLWGMPGLDEEAMRKVIFIQVLAGLFLLAMVYRNVVATNVETGILISIVQLVSAPFVLLIGALLFLAASGLLKPINGSDKTKG